MWRSLPSGLVGPGMGIERKEGGPGESGWSPGRVGVKSSQLGRESLTGILSTDRTT